MLNANACAENALAATFAIQRKNPIINAKKPPNASFPNEYPPPEIGKLVASSEKFKAIKKIMTPPKIKLIRTPGPATPMAVPKRVKIVPPMPQPIPYRSPPDIPIVFSVITSISSGSVKIYSFLIFYEIKFFLNEI